MRVCTPPPMKTLTVSILPLTRHYQPHLPWVYWLVPGHGWPYVGLLYVGVAASKAIANIPTWMGYFARWRVRCVSVSEASEILAGCKRLEKENLRRVCSELQNQFSSMWLDSTLSAAARPFQPQATPLSSREDDVPQAYPARHGLARSSPTLGLAAGSPVGRASPSHHQSSDNDGVSTWPMPLGSGPTVSPTIVIIMRILISCPW